MMMQLQNVENLWKTANSTGDFQFRDFPRNSVTRRFALPVVMSHLKHPFKMTYFHNQHANCLVLHSSQSFGCPSSYFYTMNSEGTLKLF